jgi:hypothetical protein
LQYENALLPIEVTEVGIIIEYKLLQPKNADSPIDVTDDGNVTEVKFSQL